MDVREILRQLRAGESDRAIGRNLKVNRATVKKYRASSVHLIWSSQLVFMGAYFSMEAD